MRAKYVMTNKGPIIFPGSFQHEDFAEFNPSSAGQLIIDEYGVQIFGDSISLKLKPAQFDTEKISYAFGIKGGGI